MKNSKITTIAIGVLALGATLIFPELALASGKFDIDAGVKAATSPIIKALDAHWGKGVLLAGGASALIGEGDMRQRAMRTGIGVGCSGAVVLALLAMLGD